MKQTAAWAVVSGLLLIAVLAAPAHAGTFLGQASASTQYCTEDRSYAQEAISGGNSYHASAYGVITSWMAPPTPEPGHTLQLLVLQRRYPASGVGHFFTVTGKDVVRSQLVGAFSTYIGLRIPIEAGQEVGLYVPAAQPDVTVGGMTAPAGVCMRGFDFGMGAMNRYRMHNGDPPVGVEFDYTSSGNTRRLNLFAYVEPDADRDGFGDESQDDCPTNASVQATCPRVMQPPPNRTSGTPRRKCKRKKAGRPKASVAKRRCKKKRRK